MKKMSKNKLEDVLEEKEENIDEKNKESVKEEIEDIRDDKSEHDDPLYNDIVEFAVSNNRISVSMIQKKFKINSNRAKKIVESLKEEGIIGHRNKNKDKQKEVDKEINKDEN